MNIIFDDNSGYQIVKGGLSLTSDDMANIGKTMERFEDLVTWGDYYKMTPKEFAKNELTINLKRRTSFVIDSLVFSGKIKNHMLMISTYII